MARRFPNRIWCLPHRKIGTATIFENKMKVKNTGSCSVETTGALLIRDSWGTGWGDAGYGWLPYEYVLKGLAEDFWSILKKEWVDTGVFKV